MLYHMSIAADEPQRVATVIAELWGGEALPFPPVAEGAWIAMAGDLRNSAIEVYPRGTALHEADGDADAVGAAMPPIRHTATHMALGTVLDRGRVMRIAAREGWPAKYRKRGELFGVIELWIEGCQMVEVLTATMVQEYRETMGIAKWRKMLAEMQPEAA